jgi:hypothetical protein
MSNLLLLLACNSALENERTLLEGDGTTLVGTHRPDSGDPGLDTGGEFEEEPTEEETEEPAEEPDEPTGWVCEKSFRNGCEICDDAAFTVPSDGSPTALMCVTDLGGVGYVSTNTGPAMDDGVARCQGWEVSGQSAWDHLDYVAQLVCDTEGLVHEVDLTAWAGQRIWAGVHDLPEGGGHFTEVCIAVWED